MDEKLQDKLNALKIEYTKRLPNKIQMLETHWQHIQKKWDLQQFRDFHREVHSLSGSAGTYGYLNLSDAARQLEFYLLPLLAYEQRLQREQINEITKLLNKIKTTPTTTPTDQPAKKLSLAK